MLLTRMSGGWFGPRPLNLNMRNAKRLPFIATRQSRCDNVNSYKRHAEESGIHSVAYPHCAWYRTLYQDIFCHSRKFLKLTKSDSVHACVCVIYILHTYTKCLGLQPYCTAHFPSPFYSRNIEQYPTTHAVCVRRLNTRQPYADNACSSRQSRSDAQRNDRNTNKARVASIGKAPFVRIVWLHRTRGVTGLRTLGAVFSHSSRAFGDAERTVPY